MNSRERARIAGFQIRKLLAEASLTDWIMAISTVCLLLVAMIAAAISYFQWHEMHAGGADTHELAQEAKMQADAAKAEADSMKDLVAGELEQAKATDKLALQAERSAAASIKSAQDADVSARATKEMAVISEKTLENAKENARLDQRPWLSVTTLRLLKFQENSKLEAQLVFTNSGRSPALRVSIVGSVVVLSKTTQPDFLTIAPASDYKALRAIAPQESNTWTKDSDKALLTHEKEEIENFSRVIWAQGFIRYEDAFGAAHVTQFCGYTWNEGTAGVKVVQGMDFNLCPNQNGMN